MRIGQILYGFMIIVRMRKAMCTCQHLLMSTKTAKMAGQRKPKHRI